MNDGVHTTLLLLSQSALYLLACLPSGFDGGSTRCGNTGSGNNNGNKLLHSAYYIPGTILNTKCKLILSSQQHCESGTNIVPVL